MKNTKNTQKKGFICESDKSTKEAHATLLTEVDKMTEKELMQERNNTRALCQDLVYFGIIPKNEFIEEWFSLCFYPRNKDNDKAYFTEWLNRFSEGFDYAFSRMDFHTGHIFSVLLKLEVFAIVNLLIKDHKIRVRK